MFVYCIENTVNGKKYVGQTVRPVEERWREHRSALNRGISESHHLQNSWTKYGSQNFEFYIIRSANSEDELDKLEDQLVAGNKGGYNLRPGGKTFRQTEATKRKISLANKGKPSPTKGMKFSRSEEQKDMWAVARRPNGYPIVVSPNGKEYTVVNLKGFCRRFGLWQSGMRPVVDGELSHYKGWHVKGNEETNTYKNISRGRRPQRFPMLVSPTGDTYVIDTTLRQFCKEHNLSVGCLSQVVNKIKPAHKGWKLMEK